MHMLDQIEKHHQKVNLNEKDKIRMRIQGWGERRAAGLLPSVHGRGQDGVRNQRGSEVQHKVGNIFGDILVKKTVLIQWIILWKNILSFWCVGKYVKLLVDKYLGSRLTNLLPQLRRQEKPFPTPISTNLSFISIPPIKIAKTFHLFHLMILLQSLNFFRLDFSSFTISNIFGQYQADYLKYRVFTEMTSKNNVTVCRIHFPKLFKWASGIEEMMFKLSNVLLFFWGFCLEM